MKIVSRTARPKHAKRIPPDCKGPGEKVRALLVQYRAALMEHFGVAGKQTDRRPRGAAGGGRGAEA